LARNSLLLPLLLLLLSSLCVNLAVVQLSYVDKRLCILFLALLVIIVVLACRSSVVALAQRRARLARRRRVLVGPSGHRDGEHRALC